MKRITTSFMGTLLILSALVAEPGWSASAPPTNLEQSKSQQLRRIDARISRLQDQRTCVQRATTQDAINNCREQFQKGNRQRRQKS